MTEAVLGLGGNLGDRRQLLAAALERLARHPEISLAGVSGLYETPPWGKTDQPPFLNAAALIRTTLSPRGLLEAILGVEREMGRQRSEKWGPRNVDIDILLFGAAEIDEPGLHVPHPRLTERAFALAPLVELQPMAMIAGRSAQDWLKATDTAGMELLAPSGWEKEIGPVTPRI